MFLKLSSYANLRLVKAPLEAQYVQKKNITIVLWSMITENCNGYIIRVSSVKMKTIKITVTWHLNGYVPNTRSFLAQRAFLYLGYFDDVRYVQVCRNRWQAFANQVGFVCLLPVEYRTSIYYQCDGKRDCQQLQTTTASWQHIQAHSESYSKKKKEKNPTIITQKKRKSSTKISSMITE